MAVVRCGECGGQVSTKAKACPNCGARPPKTTSRVTWLITALIAFTFLGSMCSEKPPKTPEMVAAEKAKDAASELAESKKGREFAMIENGKSAVRSVLKDGDSAQFKDVFFSNTVKGVPIACGQVNSKNSFGAYSGFQHFVSAGTSNLTFLEEQATDFHKVWNKFCVGKQKP